MTVLDTRRGKIPKDSIVTFTGKIVRPLDPDPETICIEDIAHSLSNQCRFTGHTEKFYSVAQHSVLVSEICDYPDALAALLHDASEAYIADLARPIKQQAELGITYRFVEQRLMNAIGQRFGVRLNPLPHTVKWADDVLLRAEARDLMPPGDYGIPDGDEYDREIIPHAPHVARGKFLWRYDTLA